MNYDERISFGYADLGSVKLHYATAGSGERLVILLHGFPEFWYSWRHQIVGLSDRYTVVAPDMRGYNLSDKPSNKSDYEIEKLVGDIVGLIKHFGRENAAVIGHDWGASVAWALASKRPDVIWKLGALQVPPIPIWKRNQTAAQFLASWYMFFFQLPSLPEFRLRQSNFGPLARAICESTAKPGVFSDEEIGEYRKAWGREFAITAMLNYYRANIVKRIFGKSSGLTKIAIPTLFIYGEKDRAVVPQTVEGIGDMIDAPFTEHRIAESGHWVQQESRDEVTEVIGRFLDGEQIF
ncbi:MAG: alpha/beta hydrolase [Pyrinomonadaceae bacterium]|nr:alpha/beta hydrolase [Pyrinomonadaceae bacterium]MBP6211977.1 alpha/beta hydrolase [Pyrinomonadaceae bacterium]